MPRKKKLRKRDEEDDDLLETREEHAENNCTDFHTFTYGICDYCDIEHYLIELEKPYEAELCQFCIKKVIKEMELIYNKLKIIAGASP